MNSDLCTLDNLSKSNTQTYPQKIAWVYDGVAYGGVEKYILRLLKRIDHTRYIPSIIISGYNYQFTPKRFIDELHELNVPIKISPDVGSSRLFSFIKDVKNLVRIFKEERFQLIHIQTSRHDSGRRAILAARISGIPSVLRTEHVPPSVNIKNEYSKYLIKLTDWLTNYIIVDSESSRFEQIELLKRKPGKIRRFYCGLDLASFNPVSDNASAKAELGLNPNQLVVGAVARLDHQKGIAYLIDAAPGLLRDYGPVNFLIVGEGPLEGALKEQVKRLGLTNFFHFVGFQSNYLSYIQAMDVAVMPSLYEGFSLTMLEFMAMRKALITTSHPSFREGLIDGEHGLIVPVKNSLALEEVILKLLNDRQLRIDLGNRARCRVQSLFTIERLADELMDLYDFSLQNR